MTPEQRGDPARLDRTRPGPGRGQGTRWSPIPACSLDEDGLERQRARAEHVAAAVAALRRDADGLGLELDLAPGVDDRVVAELIAAERECCPFFELGYDAGARRLTVRVPGPEHLRALEVIASALGSGGSPGG